MMFSKKVQSEFRQLHQLKFRRESGLFIAEGEKVVGELVQSGLKIKCLAALPGYYARAPFDASRMETYEVSEAELARISLLQTPNQVIAVAEQPVPEPVNFAELPELSLMLDGIRDPGNLGTIIRTADWFGVRQLFCSPDTTECYNPKVVQSAMGSLFRMEIRYGELPRMIRRASESGIRVFGAAADGEPFFRQTNTGRSMLVIGSESHGLSSEVLSLAAGTVGIPKIPSSGAESLNAAVACGILLAAFRYNRA